MAFTNKSTAFTAAERDEAESIATIHRALELGVTFLDTAETTDGKLVLSSASSGGIGFTFVPAD